MSTFQARVEDLVGTITDTTAMSDFLTAGAKHLIDLLPEDKAEKLTTTVADAGSGISVAGYKLFGAYKSGYKALFLDKEDYARYVNSDSIFYGTSQVPIAYVLDGLLYIKPGGGIGRVIAYPTVLYTASTITGIPTEWEQAVVLYAAIQHQSAKWTDASLSYTNWVTYLETNKDIELGEGELNKLKLQLDEKRINVETAKALLDSLNVQFKNLLITIGIK